MNIEKLLEALANREKSIESLRLMKEQAFSSAADIATCFPNHWIIDRPSDGGRVGGDFYFVQKCGQRTILAVVDSLGHGVHGIAGSLAIQVLISNAIDKGITNPGNIIDEMHVMAAKYLKNKVTCDLGIARWDPHSRRLDYAGAKRSAHYQNRNEIYLIPASRISIGQERGERHRVNTHTITLHQGNRLYMATDGLESQPGPDGKTLRSAGLKKWLVKTAELNFPDQKKEMATMIDSWINTGEQFDDILIVAVGV